MARLADWEVATLVHRVEELEAGGRGHRARGSASALRMVEELNEPFEELLVYVWRRHLAAAVARIEALGANEEDLHTTQRDRRVRRHRQLHRAVQPARPRTGSATSSRSSSRAAPTSSPRQRGRVIKSLGDSVLFVNEDPIRAYDIAEGIITVIGRDPRMPDVRVGPGHGLGGACGSATSSGRRSTWPPG